ncbi:response regulator transcription factor [Mucilaginibacter sp. BT774]|uniref:response regulator transcription factor n=1 Tax=Mucilaginibacter sp. BT774 TaxID=3062276 RepID=UPI002674B5E1|nr:response regulator transcription factor [Mucilaginibacter sp. BT774]MDO3627585.1 response regulator transcription factor [Mucilaginibacter sp. BT774]
MKTKLGIIDDHQLFLKSLGMLLQSFGDYELVIEAVNGQDLQDKMKRPDQIPDIMLVDVNMPVMDGPEIVRWLKQQHPVMKLVALSVNNTDKAVIEMIKAGCCAYVLKDTHPNDLKAALIEIGEKGYYNGDFSNINFRRLLQYEHDKINLNDREKLFLQYACSDLTYKQIAEKMFLSERTIDGYREALFEKLNVESRVGMVLEAIKKELVSIESINLK